MDRHGKETRCSFCPIVATTQLTDVGASFRFNIYIYDYCNKRGFRETAQKLMAEAEIPPDSAPPINAKQGLLFE
jgi:hypothetical protein